ncbi:MAG TPA: hypothetical protein VIG24_16910 [Acidimicrobiia bacterium]
MAIAARIPVADMAAANEALEAAGYGPRNFSIALYTGGPAPTYAVLHASANEAFASVIKALPNVVWSEVEGEPQDRVKAALAGLSDKWGGDAPMLKGRVTPGLHRDAGGGLWWVIQPYNTAVWSTPANIPALIRRARVPGEAAPWVQPLDQFDAYKLTNPFTGEPDRVTHNGSTWEVTQADGSGNNVWAPGAFGWTQV